MIKILIVFFFFSSLRACDCQENLQYYLTYSICDLEEFYDPDSEEKEQYWLKGLIWALKDILNFSDSLKQSDMKH